MSCSKTRKKSLIFTQEMFLCVSKCKSQKELPMLTFGRHNHCKLLPMTPQVSGSCGVLPLRIGLLQTHSQKAVILFLLHICPPCSELLGGQQGYASLLPSLVVISHSDTEYSDTTLQKPSTSPFPLMLSPNLCIQAGP